MAIVYIFLSVVCSLTIAQLLKWVEKSRLAIIPVLSVNYLTAFLISFFSSPEFIQTDVFGITDVVDIGFWILSVTLGIFFIANFLLYSKSINLVGMGVSIAAMRMSLVFPITISLLIFGESIIWLRYIGIITAFIALYMMLPKFGKHPVSKLSYAWLPVLIFVMTGFVDSGLKAFEQWYLKSVSEDIFLSIIFLVSFLCGIAAMWYRNDALPSLKEIIFGVCIGIVNLYSSVFLIFALQIMPGSLVFPVINVTLVIFGTLIGVFFWNDNPNKKQWVGLILAIGSIILLLY